MPHLKNDKRLFRQVIANFYRGPIRLRARRFRLIKTDSSGKIIVNQFTRLFGNLWIFKQKVYND